jgi:hypothetical protein
MGQQGEQRFPSLNVLYDLSVRKFEALEKAFDALNTRGAALLGWTSINFALSTAIAARLAVHRRLVGAFALTAAALTLRSVYCAWRAYGMTNVRTWPDVGKAWS